MGQDVNGFVLRRSGQIVGKGTRLDASLNLIPNESPLVFAFAEAENDEYEPYEDAILDRNYDPRNGISWEKIQEENYDDGTFRI